MAEDTQFHSLTFATDSVSEDGLSQPFAVLKTGTFRRGDFGEMKVTEADLDKAVENFQAFATKDEAGKPELPVDYDHSFAQGKGSKAAGWIKELRREGDKLLARVKWTPEASDLVRSQAFKYFSPEFTTNLKNEQGKALGFGLLAGAATSRPFLKSLGPVALSEEVAADIAENARRLADVAGIELGGDPAPSARKTPAMADEPKTVALTEAEVTQLREAASQVATLAETVKGLEESRDQAVTALTETRTELRKEQVDKLLGRARREGRIDASDETTEKWHERAEKHGVEFVADLLAEFQADTIPMSERGQGFDKPLAVTAPEGVDQADYEIDRKITALMSEKGIGYGEAFDIVTAQEAVL